MTVEQELDSIECQVTAVAKRLNQQNKLLALVGEAICLTIISECERNGDQSWTIDEANELRERLREILEE